MTRSSLGTVVACVLRAADEVLNDPMNDYAGFTPDPGYTMMEVARSCGWSLAEILHELSVRGISAKWQYHNGMGLLETSVYNPPSEIC